MDPKLVIFDCDGVLIDSEIIACRTAAEALTREGYAIDAETVARRFLGISGKAQRACVEQELGRPLSAGFDDRLHADLRSAFAAELRAMAGVETALDALRVPCCVASSSTPERLRFSLGLVGLYERFAPNVFSASAVARGKPAPDLFLFAALRMAIRPEACLVIEDSVAGVRAARAAGMQVLGFCGGEHCPPTHAARLLQEGATSVFSHMPALAALLA